MNESDKRRLENPPLDLSVVIITLNEEKHLNKCFQSLPRGSEFFVLDCGSTDQTVALARSLGAKVEHRDFTTYAEQKNAAIHRATRGWILSIDADEVLSEELKRAIEKICGPQAKSPSSQSLIAYRIKRRLFFMGRRMRFGKTTDYPLRLFRKEQGRFVHDIHEKVSIASGSTGLLKAEMEHHSYDDLSDYFFRFNDYTSKIANNHRKNGRKMPPLALHVVRPWGEFFLRYFVRLGFLDGYPGYCYALFSSIYTFVKYAKLRELVLDNAQQKRGCE